MDGKVGIKAKSFVKMLSASFTRAYNPGGRGQSLKDLLPAIVTESGSKILVIKPIFDFLHRFVAQICYFLFLLEAEI